MAKNFTPQTIKKAKMFLEEFKKNPQQLVDPLCIRLSIAKSLVYSYLRSKNISLDKIRSSTEIENKTEKKSTTTTQEQMEQVVATVDALRKKGLNITDAVKKSKLNIHYSTYYNYRNQLMAKPKVKKTANKQTKELVPIMPHTIEYIKEDKPQGKQELLMVLGSSDALLDFIGKLRGGHRE